MIAIGPAPLARRSRIPAAAAVRTRDDFEQMPVRVFKVEIAPTVVVVGLPRLSLAGVSPVGKFRSRMRLNICSNFTLRRGCSSKKVVTYIQHLVPKYSAI